MYRQYQDKSHFSENFFPQKKLDEFYFLAFFSRTPKNIFRKCLTRFDLQENFMQLLWSIPWQTFGDNIGHPYFQRDEKKNFSSGGRVDR